MLKDSTDHHERNEIEFFDILKYWRSSDFRFLYWFESIWILAAVCSNKKNTKNPIKPQTGPLLLFKNRVFLTTDI